MWEQHRMKTQPDYIGATKYMSKWTVIALIKFLISGSAVGMVLGGIVGSIAGLLLGVNTLPGTVAVIGGSLGLFRGIYKFEIYSRGSNVNLISKKKDLIHNEIFDFNNGENTILVFGTGDSSRENRENINKLNFLEKKGYEILFFNNIYQIDWYLDNGAKVILVNCTTSSQMDQIWSMIRHLKSNYEVSVIMLSSDFMPAITNPKYDIDYFDYFAEPYKEDVLEWKIRQAIVSNRRQTVFAKLLSELSHSLTNYQKGNNEKLSQDIVKRIHHMMPSADFVEMILRDGDQLKTVASFPPDELDKQAYLVAIGDGVAGQVATTGISENIGDVPSYKKTGKPFNQSISGSTLSTLMVPIAPLQTKDFKRSHILGVINLESRKHRYAFSSQDKRTIESLANLLFIAFDSERRERELSEFFRLTLHSKGNNSVDRFYSITKQIKKYSGAELAHIIFMDRETEQFTDTYEVSDQGIKHLPSKTRLYGHSREIIIRNEIIKIEDKSAHGKNKQDIKISEFSPPESKAMLGIPIGIDNKLFGVLWLHYNTTKNFNDLELQILRLCASQIALLLTVSNLEEQHEALRDLSIQNLLHPELKSLCDRVAKVAAKELKALHSGFYWFDEVDNKFYLWGGYRRPHQIENVLEGPDEHPKYDRQIGLAARVIAFGDSAVYTENYETWEFGIQGHGNYQQAVLGVPVTIDDFSSVEREKKVGVLYINKNKGYDYKNHPEDISHLQSIAVQLGFAIEIILFFERRIQKLAQQTKVPPRSFE